MNLDRTQFTSFALLGSGHVARHFAHYLTHLNLPFTSWSRREDPAFAKLEAVCAPASHILLAVSDSAIDTLYAKFQSKLHTKIYAELQAEHLGGRRSGDVPKRFVHFSGSAFIDGVVAAHPLMTFGSGLRDEAWYRSIPFVVDQGVDFAEILPGLPNSSFALARERRSFYHALCALAGNSTFLLWQKIAAQFRDELALPAEVLAPFLNQVVTNALAPEARGMATGPVARQDWDMVRAHLSSLRDHPSLAAAYRDFLNQAASGGQKIPEALL